MQTRLALLSAAAGGALAAFLTSPAFGAVAPTCAQAQFDVNQAVAAEQGTRAQVTQAENKLDADQAALQALLNATPPNPATIAAAQAQVAADQQALINAKNADNTALRNITAAEKIRDTACATTTTTAAPPTSTTVVKPPPTSVTIVRPPANTTIVNPPPPANNTTVVVPPAQPPTNTFITPQAPSSGAVATGDGSTL